MTKKRTAIIIVHYNHDQLTDETIASCHLATQHHGQIDIWVVDNGSKQPYALPAAQVLPTKLVRSESNLGFAGGNNFGIKHASAQHTYDYYLLLNNDTRLDPSCVDTLIQFSHQHHDQAITSPKIYFEKGYEFHAKSYSKDQQGKVLWYAGGSIDWKNMYAFHRAVDEVDRGQTDLPPLRRKTDQIPYFGYAQQDFATGCCLLLPAEILAQVGYLDESYFMYLEDVDYSLRVKRAGFEVLYCPQAVVWHKNAGSSVSGSTFQVKLLERNRIKIALKYAPLRTKLAVLKQYLLSTLR